MYNIILLTVDTMRFDAFNKVNTPNLFNWSRDKLIFSNCYAQSSWTRPSFGSLLTGLYPHQHSALRNVRNLKQMQSETFMFDEPLSDEVTYLPSELLERGYSTMCVQGNPTLFQPKSHNCERGFINYSLPSSTTRAQDRFYPQADVVRIFSEQMLPRLGEPFFLWVNFMDPHCPYSPPMKYNPFPILTTAYRNLKYTLSYKLTNRDKTAIYSNYLKEIQFVDEEIGKLLNSFPDNCIIIFTSDHGEEFWDHGNERGDISFYSRGVDHGHSLYSELIHVPLVIAHPRIRGCEVIRLIQHTELFDWLMNDFNSCEFQADKEHFIFAEALLYGEERKAFIKGNYKMILSQTDMEVYNLSLSEKIQVSNIKVRNELLDDLKAHVEIDWFENVGSGELIQNKYSKKIEERLKALGYL